MDERARIVKIMEYYGLTAKAFAEEVGIQAGTISNVVNGRNNPSLDVLQRIHRRYPELNALWLFAGQGQMLANTSANASAPATTPATTPTANAGEPSLPGLFAMAQSPASTQVESPNQPENEDVSMLNIAATTPAPTLEILLTEEQTASPKVQQATPADTQGTIPVSQNAATNPTTIQTMQPQPTAAPVQKPIGASVQTMQPQPLAAVASARTISRIVIFYSDGTFEER